MSDPGLVTSCVFKGGDEHVVRMCLAGERGAARRCVELTVTNKHTAETWHSSYDTAYIENLTHKTGNFKQFDVFVAMLKSGLLKSRDCITLDLLTFEDLQYLRSQRTDVDGSSELPSKSSNRRYLILTYSVEFDRIHYPLPLEYSGAPDPVLLQATIRRLEAKVKSLESNDTSKELENRLEELSAVNRKLVLENQRLANGGVNLCGKGVKRLMSDVKMLETLVMKERAAFQSELQKLQSENASLQIKLRQLSESNGRIYGSRCTTARKKNIPKSFVNVRPSSSHSIRSNSGKRFRSRSPSVTGHRKSSLSRERSIEVLKIKDSARSIRSRSGQPGSKEQDFGNLELRINVLRKMLEEGLKLN